MTRTGLLAALVGFAVASAGAGPALAQAGIETGDLVITQESPKLRRSQGSRSAGAAIFVRKPSGAIRKIAGPPAVAGPRGIRMDRDGSFVFADAFRPGIGRLARSGKITWLKTGAPLSQPKDVAIDRDGGYVIVDFAGFNSRNGARVLKLWPSGKLTTVHRGAPLVWPHGVTVDRNGDYIVADHACCIYRVTPQGQVSRIAGGAPLVAPQDIKLDSDGGFVVTDMALVLDGRGRVDRQRSRQPTKLLKVSPAGQVRPLLRKPRARFRAVARSSGGYLVVDMHGAILQVAPNGRETVLHRGPPLVQPAGIAAAR